MYYRFKNYLESETAFSTFPSANIREPIHQDSQFSGSVGSTDETRSLINRGNSNDSANGGGGGSTS